MKPAKRISALIMALALLLSVSTGALAVPETGSGAAVNAEVGDIFSSFEWEELRLTNIARMEEGLEPLSSFDAMQQGARIRSRELIELFSHTRPDGSSGPNIIDGYGVDWTILGENIAAGQRTPLEVHEGWMNSPGHRANILEARYSHMGMGYYYDGGSFYGSHWTQIFCGSCTCTKLEVLYGGTGGVYPAGTDIDDMAEALRLTCGHGVSYMPVCSSMCSGYDPAKTGEQTVTVTARGKTAALTLTLSSGGQDTPQSVTRDGMTFTPDSSGGYTVTAYDAPSAGADLVVPAEMDGIPVTGIEAGVFEGARLGSVTISEGIASVGGDAFFGAYVQGAVSLPATLTHIGTYAFSYMYGCTAINVAAGNPSYCSADGVLFNKSMTTLINYPLSRPGSVYELPESVTLLYCTSLASERNLDTLVVPNKNARAMGYTFYNASLTLYGVTGGALQSQLPNLDAAGVTFRDISLYSGAPEAYPFTPQQAADGLYSLGLFQGTDKGYELERVSSRQEGVTMLLRLLGEEDEALSRAWPHPFTDVTPWATDIIGYAYHRGYTDGMAEDLFGGGQTPTSCAQYLTFVLRALGYDDSAGDFVWYAPWLLSDELGLTLGQYDGDTAEFTRADMVLISYAALDTPMAGGAATLREHLFS